MNRRSVAAVAVVLSVVLSVAQSVLADPPVAKPLALAIVSADPAEAAAAIHALRERGPAGLETVLAAYAPEVAAIRSGSELTPELARVREAIDQVAGQRDACASGLYWFTDFAAAKREASRLGRPILSLRLLGRLDEELSCANSRFFRTALYANARIAEVLSEHFVLYWSSERPVPRITIDFGDGRTMTTTITGNSVHYVLDSRGRLVDALPGLYGPGVFLDELAAIERAARVLTTYDDAAFLSARAALLQEMIWRVKSAAAVPQGPLVEGVPSLEQGPADDAGRTAATKSVVERPMLVGMALAVDERTIPSNDLRWTNRAQAILDRCRLDEGSRAMVARHLAPDAVLSDQSMPDRSTSRDPIQRFEMQMAIDTVRNQMIFRPAIEALIEASSRVDVADVNARVYSEVFLMPEEDAWFGLRTPAAYTGIEGGGLGTRR